LKWEERARELLQTRQGELRYILNQTESAHIAPRLHLARRWRQREFAHFHHKIPFGSLSSTFALFQGATCAHYLAIVYSPLLSMTTHFALPLCLLSRLGIRGEFRRKTTSRTSFLSLSRSLFLSFPYLSPSPSRVSPSLVRCRPQLFLTLNSLPCLEVDLNRVTETRTTSPSPSSSELVGCQSLPFLSEGKAALRPLLLALFTFE